MRGVERLSVRHDAYATPGQYTGFVMALAAVLNDGRSNHNAGRRDDFSHPNFCSLSPDGEPSEEPSAASSELAAVVLPARCASQRCSLRRPGS